MPGANYTSEEKPIPEIDVEPPTMEELKRRMEEQMKEPTIEWLRRKMEEESRAKGTPADTWTPAEPGAPRPAVEWSAGAGPAFMLGTDEVGIVFEALGLSLRQVFNQAQTNLDYVYKATRIMERMTPVVQELAAAAQKSQAGAR